MPRLYKRDYELNIITPDNESLIIKDLRIQFEITKSTLSYPNLARINIFNLSDNSLSFLKQKFTKIIFNSGYEGFTNLLFTGEIRNVFQPSANIDRVVTIYAGDGEQDWQNSIINKTFSETVSIRTAINEVLKSFKNLEIGTTEGLPDEKDKLRGLVLSGSSKDVLDKLAEEYGFLWSIQDSEIITTPVEQSLTDSEAILINNRTGMIGSPSITETGVDVTTLLNPRLRPNGSIIIESITSDLSVGNLFFRNIKNTEAEGKYKIQEVTFKGDSREGDWISKVKGWRING